MKWTRRTAYTARNMIITFLDAVAKYEIMVALNRFTKNVFLKAW